jgi:kinesin family member 11
MSTYIIGLFDKYVEETSKLQSHSNNTHEAQMKSIEDFQMVYEVNHLSLFFVCCKIL